MSQEKVDRYKAEKKNRPQEIKKAKQRKVISRIVGAVVVVAIAVWIGYSGYNVYQSNKGIETVTVNTSGITDYLSGL
ncbi:MAG: hypothetical protein LIO75_03080 [Lachnospiraceae bacterium]|nr:hypothetical protein [Lachnospiraceae bacterium]